MEIPIIEKIGKEHVQSDTFTFALYPTKSKPFFSGAGMWHFIM